MKFSIKKKIMYPEKILNAKLYFLRSRHPDVFCEKGVLRNFTKFTGKHVCQVPFFNKFADLKPAALSKKRLWHRCFPAKFLQTPSLTEHVRWLLLSCRVQVSRHTFRSSQRRCSLRKGVLRNFIKFIGKQLCQSLLFNEVAGLRPQVWHWCFPVNFVKFLRTPFLQNTPGRLQSCRKTK